MDELDGLQKRIEMEIQANREAINRVESDSVKRESRQAYMIAHGRNPPKNF